MSYIGANQSCNIPQIFKFRARMMGGRGVANKSLFTTFDEEDDFPSDDAIKVFLRLKPRSGNDENVIDVLDSKTVLFKMPQELAQAQKKLNIPSQVKYTFSKIFKTDVTQAEIFNGCVSSHIKDLFNGGHCLLFTYGTTNAGKTFTVLGTGNQPGIIPRTLTTVFKSIKGKEYGSSRIMPHMFNSAIELGDQAFEEERVFKKRILTWSHEKSQLQSDSSRIGKSQASSVHTSTDEIIGESVFREMQRRLTNDTDIIDYKAEPDEVFSVWVSFAEIYNESIFDLLQPVTSNCKRKPLKLAQDSNNRNTYIKGLKHVFVQSEEEAYRVLMFGKNNLQVAATGMNSRSSRSHCIFSIKLIKCPNVDSPEKVLVSSFSICDLAGAERQKKALNVGLRLKESQNINCSLHVLSRCFSIIRENQLNNEHKLVPFRDSKLTQLFQHALLGKESVTMIVNVNSDVHLCEETQHVLKASAIAKHIVVQPRPVTRPPRPTRQSVFSQIISKHSRSTLIRWDSCVKPKGESSIAIVEDSITTQNQSEKEEKQEQYENCLALVEDLKEKLKEEKSKHNEAKKYWKQRELEIREEMKTELKRYLDEAKKQNELDLKRARSVTEDADCLNEDRLIGPKECAFKKPRTLDKNDLEDDVFHPDVNELLDEVKMQQKHIESLTDYINIQREEKKEITLELTSAKMQLGWKDKEIKSLNNKIEMFSEESELRTAYLELEKEMDRKVMGRDALLEEARDDLLAEIRMKEDLEEEIEKLEAELSEKEEKILIVQSEVEDLKHELSEKSNVYEALQQQMDDMQSNFDDEIKTFESHVTRLEGELIKKNEEIKELEQKSLHCNNSPVKFELAGKVESLEHELQKLTIEKLEVNNTYEDTIKNQLQELLQKSKKIEELEEIMKKKQIESDKILNEQNTELSVLQKSLKDQIQETGRFMEDNAEMQKKINHINMKLTQAKMSNTELLAALKNKEHELECSRSEITGIQSSLPTLEAEFQLQRTDYLNCKRRCEDLQATIYNMRQEMDSFQSNQKEIIGKYEDQLKKAKEENENLKKEVARLTTTFYKTTPTPKKDLEKKLDDIKKQLEDAVSTCLKLKMENEDLRSKAIISYGQENVKVKESGKAHLSTGGRHRILSDDEIVMKPSMKCNKDESTISKSAHKIQTRRTRAARAAVESSECENDIKENEKPQKQPRKKLQYTASLHVPTHEDFDDDVGVETIPQESPETNFRRARRHRPKENKLGKYSTKSEVNCQDTCNFCFDKEVCSRRKGNLRRLYSHDDRVLRELNRIDMNSPVYEPETEHMLIRSLRKHVVK